MIFSWNIWTKKRLGRQHINRSHLIFLFQNIFDSPSPYLFQYSAYTVTKNPCQTSWENSHWEMGSWKFPEVKILNGLSLSIQRGQKVAVVGESGSGKSTVMALLERFPGGSTSFFFWGGGVSFRKGRGVVGFGWGDEGLILLKLLKLRISLTLTEALHWKRFYQSRCWAWFHRRVSTLVPRFPERFTQFRDRPWILTVANKSLYYWIVTFCV